MRHARRVTTPWARVVLVAIGVASVAIVLVLALPGAQPPAVPANPWAVSGPLVTASIPVTRCPTSFGVPGSREPHLPRVVRADVSEGLVGDVAVFTDGLGTLDVVAPASWPCTALDAVDGSSTVVVYPPGAPRPSWGTVTAVASGVVASQTGACVGCSLETACPLFPGAARAYAATYGISCHRASPADELRTRESPSKVLFIDPPGVLGAGRPSGGGLVAYGAAIWRAPGSRFPTAWLDTCTLPRDDHDLCVVSVRTFLARHPR